MFKNLYSDLVEHKEKLSLVGLGEGSAEGSCKNFDSSLHAVL